MGQTESKIAWHDEPGLDAPGSVDYHSEWKAFALRRYVALFLLYTWVPVCFGLFWLSRYYIHQPVACLTVMAVWLGCALSAVWWAGEFRCPRCRRRYGALGHRKGDTNITRGLWDKVCANCKLTKFEIVR
jgi:hypothetical protein